MSSLRYGTTLALCALCAWGCSDDNPVVPDGGAPDLEEVDAAERLDFGPDMGVEVPMTWVSLSAGAFEMGSPDTEICRSYEEVQHRVTLTRGFELSATEITQAQFYRLMGYNPSVYQACGSQCPAENISWHEAAAYCNALSTQAGFPLCYSCQGKGESVTCTPASGYTAGGIYGCSGYRLPTEAEWEYAYRAGTTSSFYGGEILRCVDSRNEADFPNPADDPQLDKVAWAIAWYDTNTSGQLQPVGQKQANSWGLYDMAGSVWEWCSDWRAPYATAPVSDPGGPQSGFYRILRGGAAESAAMYIRAAYRLMHSPEYRDGFTGFRVARTL